MRECEEVGVGTATAAKSEPPKPEREAPELLLLLVLFSALLRLLNGCSVSLVAGDGVRVVPINHRPRAPFMIGKGIYSGVHP